MVLAATTASIVAGGLLWLAGAPVAARWAWGLGTAAALLPLTVGVVRDLRSGRMGVDLIALLAMAGSLALGEQLAGAVVAVMLSGGQVLERYAEARARRELSALVDRAPRVANRLEAQGPVVVPAEEIRPAERLLVKPGEAVSVDGTLESPAAVLDESALSGEARPVEHAAGALLRSGSVNAGQAFTMRAEATAAGSTYAAIVRLTREAAASKAPLVRLADRYAIVLLPLALAVAGGAWLASGDPVRGLAVLVVATPCPLILAAPVAMVAGMSRAAGRGVIVKGGAALEALARARVVLLDKTGTITEGRPALVRIARFGALPGEQILRLAASLDQVSAHVLAGAVVAAAQQKRLRLSAPAEVTEVAGAGIRGDVDGRQVALGRAAYAAAGPLPAPARRLRARSALDGSIAVFVAVDGELVGALVLEDRIRAEAALAVRQLRSAGVMRVLIVTGDRPAPAEAVGRAVGADGVLADQQPAEKLAVVRAENHGGTTVMVGDGINDAPALAAADVGVAMGARGATASSEAADVVVTVDRLDRIGEAIAIARRARRIALESILVGMGLSLGAMVMAAVGLLPPVQGALLQEGIDVLVIVNALRALGGGVAAVGNGGGEEELARLAAEHRRLRAGLDELLETADALGRIEPTLARRRLVEDQRFLNTALLPHEMAEEASLYPLVARAIGGRAPTEVMIREHAEIGALVRHLDELVAALPSAGPADEDLPDLRRLLYGLHAVLLLHLAKEDQSYLPLLQAA